MRAATVVQVLQDLFYCMFYFTCDRSFIQYSRKKHVGGWTAYLEKIGTVYQLSCAVVYQQCLGDAVNRKPVSDTAADDGTPARLGWRGTHWVVRVRAGHDLA